MPEASMKTRLRYHRRYTDLIKEQHDLHGLSPKQAAPAASKKLLDEWAAESGGEAPPEWLGFAGSAA